MERRRMEKICWLSSPCGVPFTYVFQLSTMHDSSYLSTKVGPLVDQVWRARGFLLTWWDGSMGQLGLERPTSIQRHQSQVLASSRTIIIFIQQAMFSFYQLYYFSTEFSTYIHCCIVVRFLYGSDEAMMILLMRCYR